MSNHQKVDGIAELVRPLLKRLQQAKERVLENSEMDKTIDHISTVVEKTKEILKSREILDKELAGYFGKVERQIDPLIDRKPIVKASIVPQIEVGQSSNQSHQISQLSNFGNVMQILGDFPQKCMLILSLFPVNAELNRFMFYYLFNPNSDCENIFSYLVNKNILIPVHRDRNKVIDRVTIDPMFHKWLISNREGYGNTRCVKREEGNWCIYMGHLLNIDQMYLDSKEIIDTMDKCDDLEVVQLGSWRYTTEVYNGVKKSGSEETKLKDHIEVDQTDFLKKLGKHVYYLSLRGISRIAELPESIGKLRGLVVLDLRACHNLEQLPQKPSSRLKPKSRWFKNLKVLDISQCYLLDHMPKWICELSKLEVLRGFVVGRLGNKDLSCHLGDLSNLKVLQKLSIRISNEILYPEIFKDFNSLNNLLALTIIWRQNKEIPTYSLPKNIEKLDIRCYPEVEVLSKMENPEELTNLKRLYIRGGNVTKIPCHHNWNVEILRLRFLNKLVDPTNWEELRSSFKKLKYLEYVGCNKPENFPNNGSTWHNEE